MQLQSILTLGLLCLILYGSWTLSKRVKRQRFTGEIKIVDRCPVENNVSLAIATIRNQDYLVSISPSGVQVLNELNSLVPEVPTVPEDQTPN